MVKFLIDLYYLRKRMKEKEREKEGLEKLDKKKEEEERKKLIEMAKKEYIDKELKKIRNVVGSIHEFPHILEYALDNIEYAEKYGIIKRVEEKGKVKYEPTEIYEQEKVTLDPAVVWFAGKLAEKWGVKDKDDFVTFFCLAKDILIGSDDLPHVWAKRYKEEFSDWHKFLKEFERRFIERYKDKPIIKKYIEKMQKLLPGWRMVLDKLDTEKLHVEDAKKLAKILRSLERAYDEAISHIEDKGRVDEHSFEIFVENLKRKHEEHEESLFEALKGDVHEVAGKMEPYESIKVFNISKEIVHRLRSKIGEKLAEKMAKNEEFIHRNELIEMHKSLRDDLSELHERMRDIAMRRFGRPE